jgi:tRNA (mo5U34)-methyltransferase
LLDSNAEYVQGNVYELPPEMGTFDIVFLFGVFYHLRYPLLALDRISEITKQYLLLESHFLDNSLVLGDRSKVPLAEIDPRLADIPLFRFYREDEMTPGDFSNWFSPNRRAIEDSLWSAGFMPEFLSSWNDRIAYRGIKLAGLPEYKMQTYEGLRYVKGEGGKFCQVLPRRQMGKGRG